MTFFRNLFSRCVEAGNNSATTILPPPGKAAGGLPAPPIQPSDRTVDSTDPPADCLAFPLKAITDLFPPELQASLRKQPSEHVHVHFPRSLIQPRLPSGAIRISFAELRAATPAVFFQPDGAHSDASILLPLDIVLRQMMPCRREDQRQPCIPVNIPSIFIKTAKPAQMGANGAAARESAEPWYFQRRPTYESKAEVPDSNMAPSTPSTRKKPFRPMASERPRRELEPGSEPEAPSIPPVPAASYTPPDSLSVPLFGVLAVLPSEIRRALNGSDARITAFVIPLDEIETRMRSGRLHFKWSQLRAWCSVGVSALAAPDMDIDLPLATVVPLFMAARETPVARKQVEVDTRIRDVFSKSKKSPGGSATFSSRDNPTSASPPRPAAGQAGLTAPAQIIEHLRALDGVTGAFISTADGLLVAGDVPDASENVLAAFAPTVFAQLTKYSDMARLGLPESIDIHLTGTTVHVRKADKLFLGILIPGSRLLPFQEITRISAALQPHSS